MTPERDIGYNGDGMNELRALIQTPIFKGLPLETVERIERELPRKTVGRGGLIIHQGQKSAAAYVLLDGKIEAYYDSADGRTVSIILHSAPFFFGAFELIGQTPYLANVKAIERCQLAVLKREVYLRLLHSHHQIAVNMVAMLSHLMCVTGEDRRVKFFGQVKHLLANTLCALSELYGERHKGGILIAKRLKQEELADMLGVSRKSVLRALRELKGANLVAQSGGYFILRDIDSLRKMARSF
jgi:CRP-like cAMP-binding protein